LNILYRAGALKKIAALMLFCAVMIPSVGKVSAQTQGAIKITARAGLDGTCRLGEWLPVRVMVENKGTDFEARVQASYRNDQGGNSVYAVNISLPATSRKEFFLYIHPIGSIRNFSVIVLDGQTELARQNLNVSCAVADDLIFGVLSDDPAPYDILNDIRALSGGKTRLAQLTLADVPDRVQGWSALDALIVSNVDTGRLTADQKQALQLWVTNGGRLLITGGIHWQTTTAGLQDVLPVTIVSTKNVTNLSALSAYMKDATPLDNDAILASGEVLEGARVLAIQDNVPLLIEKKIGYGKAYYLAVDPGLQPLDSWSGMKDAYDHLLAFKPQKPIWANAAWNSSQANSALSALPELDLPSFLYICGWLGIYVLAVGPVNYLILRRVKRAELAWVTIPVLVILFSCLAYISGFAYRGVNPILNRLALAQGWDGESQARVNDLVGVYSPSRAAYNVQTQDRFMLYQLYRDTDLQGGNDWLLYKNELGTTLPDVRVEIGGMASVGAEGYMPALNIQHDLTVTLTKNAPTLTGTITNTSGHALREAVLVTPGEWYALGDFAPNQSKKINRTLFTMPNPIEIQNLLSDLGMVYYSSSADRALTRRSAFFRANVIGTSGNITNAPGIYLMGWLDDVSAPVDLQDQNSETVDTMLYFQKIAPYVVSNLQYFTLNSSLYDWESSIGEIATNRIPSDGYDIRFQLGEPVDFSEVVSLDVNVINNGAPGKAQAALWNFEEKTWDEVSLSWSTSTNVSSPARYVGANGEIRMRLTADQNDYVQIYSVNFSLGVMP